MIEDYSIKPSHLGGHLNRTNLDRPLLEHLKKKHNISKCFLCIPSASSLKLKEIAQILINFICN